MALVAGDKLGPFEIVHSGLDIWRAPTENDRYVGTGETESLETRWREAGFDRLVESRYGARSRWGAAATDVGFDTAFEWRSSRTGLRLAATIERRNGFETPLPRLGIVFALRVEDPGGAQIEWLGLGPGETYPDSRSAAWFGRPAWRRSLCAAMAISAAGVLLILWRGPLAGHLVRMDPAWLSARYG